MSVIGVIDVGATSIKYGVWKNSQLFDKGAVQSPENLENFYKLLGNIVGKMKEKHGILGVGMSTPGAVNKETGVIGGYSFLKYLHNFPIKSELEKLFGLPLSLENDANCAAIAELHFGAGINKNNILVITIGTGIGGSVIVDRKLQHGKDWFSGEFGFMFLNDSETFSTLGSPVKMAKRYTKRINNGSEYSGKEVFDLARSGDVIAQEEVEVFYSALAKGVYNLQCAFDPELIILGGAVSEANFLLPELNKRLEKILERFRTRPFILEVVTCKFQNDAGLVGAAADFICEHPNLQ